MIMAAIPFASSSFTTATSVPSHSHSCRITQISCKKAAPNKWNTALNLIININNPITLLDDYNYNSEELYKKRTQKIMNVRKILQQELGGKQQPLIKSMVMIDSLQRLEIDYYFQDEIEAELFRLHETTTSVINYQSRHDLLEVSLYFRLLRQQGFYVHADVFNNFKNKEGKFVKKKLMKEDVRSVMELYEASQLRIHGEYILDEAEILSNQILTEWMMMTPNVDRMQAEMIANTLKHPYHKSLARFDTGINHLSKYIAEGNDTWENTIRELSFMDSFISQTIHRTELHKISKWWKDLGLTKEMKLARDQPLKWFAWSMAVLPNIGLSDERVDLTKSVSLIYVIDDIFDLYGTLEELTLFTHAVNRWELDAVEKLPEYMKMSFRALYDITNETGQMVAKKHGCDISLVTLSLQKAWASLCNAYLVEANWFALKETPKAEDYLKNGIVSSGVHVTLVHLFFLLGLGSSENNANLLQDSWGIISSVATILRLWNDLGSTKDEGEHGHDYSYIDYYMKEVKEGDDDDHHNVWTVEMGREHVIERISVEWKRLNKECLSLNRTSAASFKKGALNLARMVPLMYDYDNRAKLPSLGHYITRAMFHDDDVWHIREDNHF